MPSPVLLDTNGQMGSRPRKRPCAMGPRGSTSIRLRMPTSMLPDSARRSLQDARCVAVRCPVTHLSPFQQLTFDPTLISETIQGCSKPEGFFNEECKLGYRCQRGYKPDITDYNTVDGYRNLTCRLTRGQYNWVDSKGVQVAAALIKRQIRSLGDCRTAAELYSRM